MEALFAKNVLKTFKLILGKDFFNGRLNFETKNQSYEKYMAGNHENDQANCLEDSQSKIPFNSKKDLNQTSKFLYSQIPKVSITITPKHKKLRCHYCRSQDMDKDYIICSNYPKCLCGFCHDCLIKVFNFDPNELSCDWNCVVCQRICSCKRCTNTKKSKKEEDGKTLVIDNWKRGACLKHEKVYHGLKQYNLEINDSEAEYIPDIKFQRKRQKNSKIGRAHV